MKQLNEIWEILETDDWSVLRILIYLRVSSEDQKKHGISMDVQLKRLKEFLEDKKVRHYAAFSNDEGKTATTTKNRHDYNKIINNLNEYDVILCTKLDRWSRNLKDLLICIEQLEQNNTVLYTLDEAIDYRTSNGWIMMVIQIAISQMETLKTAERVQDIHQQQFKDGSIISRPVLGLKIEKIMQGKKVIERKIIVVSELWEKIQYCFKETIKGTSYKVICQFTGFAPQTYYNIIRNPFYKGFQRYENEFKEIESNIPRCVSEQEWNMANKILDERKKKWRNNELP